MACREMGFQSLLWDSYLDLGQFGGYAISVGSCRLFGVTSW
jgi:hypothetical protein